MSSSSMTPRERWSAVLEGKEPDRIPLNYRATGDFTKKFLDQLSYNSIIEVIKELHIDNLFCVRPTYDGPTLEDNEDAFGCQFKLTDYGGGSYKECIHHPLQNYNSVEEIEANFEWPDPNWWDYSNNKIEAVFGEIEVNPEDIDLSAYPIWAGYYEPFLRFRHLRGSEQAYKDIIRNPNIVNFCLDHLVDLEHEKIKRTIESTPYDVLITVVAEDLGSQKQLLFPLEKIKEFFFPRMKRIIELAHNKDSFVFTHSDGAMARAIPGLVDIGIDILDPIQWRCDGMDRKTLKSNFGEKIAFHGAMDNQYTLANGDVEEIKSEVIENIKILGKDGKYVLAPCHNIQSVSEPVKIEKMYQVAYTHSWLH